MKFTRFVDIQTRDWVCTIRGIDLPDGSGITIWTREGLEMGLSASTSLYSFGEIVDEIQTLR